MQPIVGGLEHAAVSVGVAVRDDDVRGREAQPDAGLDRAARRPGGRRESCHMSSVPAVDWFTIATRAPFRAALETVLYV